MQGAFRKTGVFEHGLVLGKSVGIASGGAREHDKTKTGGGWRADAVFVGHKLQCDYATAGLQCRMHAPQQFFAGRFVEVMQDICQEHEIIVRAQVHFERAAGQ